ncbi:MAG: hypothetical protein DMD91_27100 [Candidatus Rokuibacteriota bacterium]|nr:MAG: hypothetical protein DMD91_27100 [Candidatus Rokubacteria bacterium]
MKAFLKGNYTLTKVIEEKKVEEATATEEFEKKALSRLGGSICFVSKKGFLWKGDEKKDGSRKANR